MNAKKVIKGLLLGFVLITIGFALGKETTLRGLRRAAPPAEAVSQPAGDKVIVYYMHQTFRCVTCNAIEKMTGELLQAEFAPQLQSGRLEWRQEDFQENEALAKRYDVASSTVVLVLMRDGQEIRHKRLDEVWTLADNRQKFIAYVGGAVREFLNGGKP